MVMQKTYKFYLLGLVALAAFFIFSSTKQTPPPASVRTFIIPHVDANKQYWFAGERVPVENFDVKERLERELILNTYLHSATILNLKNAPRFFPAIEATLKEYGLPDDLKYIAVAESNFRNGTSSAGAKGVWQFMPGTAGEYGLEVNDEVDERMHLEKSTHAACAYLKKYKERFGSWTLTAAAYNMGAGGLSGDLSEQRGNNYYDLNLSEETNRYIFRIIAIKEIMANPKEYGFELQEDHLYPPMDKFAVVTVDSSIASLGDFAVQYGTTYRMLKLFNPWLRGSRLSIKKGKNYEIKIPK